MPFHNLSLCESILLHEHDLAELKFIFEKIVGWNAQNVAWKNCLAS